MICGVGNDCVECGGPNETTAATWQHDGENPYLEAFVICTQCGNKLTLVILLPAFKENVTYPIRPFDFLSLN